MCGPRKLETALAVLLLAFASATPGGAGSSGQTAPYTPAGDGTPITSGDYVSTTTGGGGLGSAYHYFVEVTPGLSRLVIDLFDADVGIALATNEDDAGRDRARTSAITSTTATYTVLDPAGTVRATLNGNSWLPADNAWNDIFDTNFPQLATQTTNVLGGTAANIPLNVPANTAANDLLLAVVSRNSGTNAINTPAGWNLINDGACNNSAINATCRMAVFYRLATAAEPASYTFTWTGNQNASGAMLRYAGVDTTTPIDVAAVANGGNNAAPVASSVTAASANTRIVRFMTSDGNVLANTVIPTGLTGRVAQNSGGNVSLAEADVGQAAAVASGTATFALTGAATWRTLTVAIRRAATPPARTAGHWELRLSMGGGGDAVNAIGLRAHDGDPSGNGTELNVYYDSMNNFGVNPPASGPSVSRAYSVYPYVASGCAVQSNDFDFDSEAAGLSTQEMDFASRTGAFTQTLNNAALSQSNAWGNPADTSTVIAGWTSNSSSVDYGIWREDVTISPYSGNGNYTTVYMADFQAAAPPPTANPQTNALRTYLPTDGGNPPVEPYIEQLLTYVSGPNPPRTAPLPNTTTFAVTVRVVNPTSAPITFSTPGNVVTSNVPAPATYQGNAQVTAGGSVTSQPAIGGTGNVVWNPVSVGANSTAILSYRVALTPAAAGTFALTGTPASNGTRAQFVDQTGNTTQGRATRLVGPICQLAATVGTLTPAVVASVRAHASPRGVEVEWETASEVGTAGFDLLRWDPATHTYAQMNQRLLPGLQGSPQGGRYRFVDESAPPIGAHWYALSETATTGERRIHGPYLVPVEPETPASAARASSSSNGFDGSPRRASTKLARSLAVRRNALGGNPLRPATRVRPTALQMGVDRSGLYFVSTPSIASGLGLSQGQVRAFVSARRLSLSNQGAAVAWTSVPGGIVFYGQAINSIYTTDNVYWLRVGPGLTMRAEVGGRPYPVGPASFDDVAHAEENRLPATLVSTDPDSDYWYWDFLSGGDPSYDDKTFPITVTGSDPSGSPGRLTVRLHGATTTGTAGEHHATISLNGSPVGEAQWEGIAPEALDIPISPTLIHDGTNTVEIKALLDAGVPYSIFYVGSFDLAYSRSYHASGDALAFHGGPHGVVTVSGFDQPAIGVFDVSVPAQPRRVTATTVDSNGGAFRVSFVPSGPDAAYVAATPAAWLAPKWMAGYRSAGLKTRRGADYVVLTTTDLFAAAQRLGALRQRGGLRPLVVDVADVMAEFSDGISDPRSIRAFLKWASLRWSPAPRFLVIAGQGTFDYKDYLGFGGNLVPPLMASTPSGLFASDNRLVDFDDDGRPDIAVGRIPVLTPAELDGYVSKLEAYASASGDWEGRALWLADKPDGAVDFPNEAESLVPGVSRHYSAERIYLASGTIQATRTQLFNGLNAGAGLMNYVGHGGIDRLAAEGLLVSSDAATLANGSRLPLLTALTCTINRFEVPGYSPLGSELVKNPAGGASAVWAPTGLSIDTDARDLGEIFYSRLAAQPGARIGEVVKDALRTYGSVDRERSLLSVYNLLGDPAITLKAPPPPLGGGGSGPEIEIANTGARSATRVGGGGSPHPGIE